jgi:hypothetical protein
LVEEEKGFVREKMAMVEDWAAAAGVATDAWTSYGDRSGTGRRQEGEAMQQEEAADEGEEGNKKRWRPAAIGARFHRGH